MFLLVDAKHSACTVMCIPNMLSVTERQFSPCLTVIQVSASGGCFSAPGGTSSLWKRVFHMLYITEAYVSIVSVQDRLSHKPSL